MYWYFKYIIFFCFGLLLQAQNPVFVHMSTVSNLPDVEFYDILEDDDHYIWLAADKGLYRYNGKNYKKNSQAPFLPLSKLKKISLGKAKKKAVWIGLIA